MTTSAHKFLPVVTVTALVVSIWLAGASRAELPDPNWSDEMLVSYAAADEATLFARRFDHLTVYRDRTVTIGRHSRHQRTRWRMMCLGDRQMKRLRGLLRRARRLDEDLRTQPYPVRGRQAIGFGKYGAHNFQTLPDESLPPMRGKLRRKLFRNMERLRQRAIESDRTRPCGK